MASYDEWKKKTGAKIIRSDSIASQGSAISDGIPVGGEASTMTQGLRSSGLTGSYVEKVLSARGNISRAPSVISTAPSNASEQSLIQRLGRVEAALAKIARASTVQQNLIEQQSQTMQRQEQLIEQQSKMLALLTTAVVGKQENDGQGSTTTSG